MNACVRGGATLRWQVLRLPAPQAWTRRAYCVLARHAPARAPWLPRPGPHVPALLVSLRPRTAAPRGRPSDKAGPPDPDHRERVVTIPNALTMARILSSPYIGYLIVQGRLELALAGCVVFGLTDALDGYIARRYNMKSFVGSIIDPAADKVLMTTLTVALAYGGLLPTPLAAVIIGRDVALSLAAFVVRWATLPPPKTLRRYFDLSIPSVEVRPTWISKCNTALQLLLMGATLAAPVFGVPAGWAGLVALQWLTGATTVVSGLGYLVSKDAVHRLTKAEVAKRLPKPHSIRPKK
ncbi:hypothetical protein IWQ56_003403 [Coemansia nantahalensis]|nr:hypothetical protein IWQ56_003403 [Coemansia nantahalensis]